jgi:hypothetical protein
MKWIWAILLLVVAAGGVAVFWPESSAPVAPATPAPASVSAKAPAPSAPAVTPKPAAPAKPAPATATAAATTAPTAKPATTVATTSTATTTTPAKPLKATPREPILKEVPPGGLTLGLDKKIPHATVTPGSIMKQPDGSLLADGKYKIEGDGSREKPYRIGWDCLASANKTYIPRLKEDLMPQRVALLDGAWVRIDGYFALPLMLQESSEILVMLNQWDGCCIGVPPTPYDAMEVKLVEPVKPNRRHAFNFGTVLGRLRVDPMLVENWLVGLYRLEEATLTQSGL